MITALMMWAFDVQIPNWMIPVAAIVGFGALIAAVKTSNKK